MPIRRFLEDWDGRLPAPWKLDPATSTFAARARRRLPDRTGHEPERGRRRPPSRHRCALPRCLPARPRREHRLLQDPGRRVHSHPPVRRAARLRPRDEALRALPERLRRQAAAALDTRPPHRNVPTRLALGRVQDRARDEPAAGAVPLACRASLPRHLPRLHDDVIGALRLPAGRYRITRIGTGAPSCAASSGALTRFLDLPSGRLPRPWRLDAQTGTFTRGTGGGFRVKPVR